MKEYLIKEVVRAHIITADELIRVTTNEHGQAEYEIEVSQGKITFDKPLVAGLVIVETNGRHILVDLAEFNDRLIEVDIDENFNQPDDSGSFEYDADDERRSNDRAERLADDYKVQCAINDSACGDKKSDVQVKTMTEWRQLENNLCKCGVSPKYCINCDGTPDVIICDQCGLPEDECELNRD
jgi:hypothetical protein